MMNEFLERQLDTLLEEASAALGRLDWQEVRSRAQAALAFDPDNEAAKGLIAAADRAIGASQESARSPQTPTAPPSLQRSAHPEALEGPTSFANGRYEVRRFLGEGGKKRVYLAHDTLLDRDVAFALIKTEGLDEVGRQRITYEAQAMGRLGDHPNIVTVPTSAKSPTPNHVAEAFQPRRRPPSPTWCYRSCPAVTSKG